MKIWIDLTNSPHINFFKPFIEKWGNEGHEILITARDLANTLDLINQNSWEYLEVGGHAGKNKVKKLMYFPKRVFELIKVLRKEKPNIGISHSSFYSPIVCKLLNFPSIYLNDNEHAKGNYIAFKFATLNLLPEFLSKKAIDKGWTKKYNIEFYPGIKEGVYLSQRNIDSKKAETSNKVFIRLEPWTAEYYKGKSEFMDDLIKKLIKKYEINILPRSKEQAEYFKKLNFTNLLVHGKPLELKEIIEDSKLFIGAGGSMTRELAFAGIPTYSVYQGDLLEVDKFLIQEGILEHNYNPSFEIIEDFISKNHNCSTSSLEEKGSQAFKLISAKLNYLGKK